MQAPRILCPTSYSIIFGRFVKWFIRVATGPSSLMRSVSAENRIRPQSTISSPKFLAHYTILRKTNSDPLAMQFLTINIMYYLRNPVRRRGSIDVSSFPLLVLTLRINKIRSFPTPRASPLNTNSRRTE